MTVTLSATCVFAGDNPQAKPDAAAEALRAAGYEVFRLPLSIKAMLEIEGDDFIEAHREADDFIKIRREAEVIKIRRKAGDKIEDEAKDEAEDEAYAIRAMQADVGRIIGPFGGDMPEDCHEASGDPFDWMTSVSQAIGEAVGKLREKTNVGFADIRSKLDIADARLAAGELRLAAGELRIAYLERQIAALFELIKVLEEAQKPEPIPF